MIARALSVRSQTLMLVGCLVLNACLASHSVAQTHAVRVGDYQFTIPVGMRIEPVATEELTTWPIVVDWDQQGRLLVVESGGVSKPIVEHNKQLLHRVVRLDDQNQDGIFDKRTVVAKDLPFMEGVLCVGNDLLVSAPPNIYRLIDADGDGVCEDRQIWFDGQTITGCANDLHGPYMGRDGWIYWCKGAFAEQQHDLLNGQRLTTTAAHIFRRRLSGGAIEPVMTGGMDNPVEVAIIPEGERFFTSTFLHNPGNGLRDGVAHAVYGGVHGKQHAVLDGHVRTGELMPVLVDLGGGCSQRSDLPRFPAIVRHSTERRAGLSRRLVQFAESHRPSTNPKRSFLPQPKSRSARGRPRRLSSNGYHRRLRWQFVNRRYGRLVQPLLPIIASRSKNGRWWHLSSIKS